MTPAGSCLVDSDVFITARNRYYSFDICPGSWKSVVHHRQEGRVFSIDRVRSELLAGQRTDDLVRWVEENVPRDFFLPVDTDAVASAFEKVMMWVQRHPKYFDHAKAKFATGADGWLVACGQVNGATVVTNEQSAPESRRQVKLPDVCDAFEVRRANIFDMLRALNVRFDWSQPRY